MVIKMYNMSLHVYGEDLWVWYIMSFYNYSSNTDLSSLLMKQYEVWLCICYVKSFSYTFGLWKQQFHNPDRCNELRVSSQTSFDEPPYPFLPFHSSPVGCIMVTAVCVCVCVCVSSVMKRRGVSAGWLTSVPLIPEGGFLPNKECWDFATSF